MSSNSWASLANTVTNSYDERQRLAQTTRPHDDTLDAITLYAYDANNNLTTLTDPKGQALSHTYDPVNRLQRTDQREGAPDPGVQHEGKGAGEEDDQALDQQDHLAGDGRELEVQLGVIDLVGINDLEFENVGLVEGITDNLSE